MAFHSFYRNSNIFPCPMEHDQPFLCISLLLVCHGLFLNSINSFSLEANYFTTQRFSYIDMNQPWWTCVPHPEPLLLLPSPLNPQNFKVAGIHVAEVKNSYIQKYLKICVYTQLYIYTHLLALSLKSAEKQTLWQQPANPHSDLGF